MTTQLIVTLSILLTACSVETMNVGAEDAKQPEPAPKEEIQEEGRTGEEGPAPKEETTVTTTTTEVKTTAAAGAGDDAKTFHLSNKNQAVDKFVSENYCRGSALRDCWLKSGKMTETDSGAYVVSLEFWETSNTDEPYKVVEATISVSNAMLLTTNAKIPGDESIEYRFLWAVVDPEKKTLDIVYDYASDGPQGQGDETLQSFVFTEKAVP